MLQASSVAQAAQTVGGVLSSSQEEVVLQLLLAAFLGGLVGWERELHEKAAGLRTNLLICVGAALFTQLSAHVSSLGSLQTPADPTRIASQIVSGIGFLGAGAIIQSRAQVTGLTTAATIWIVAAIGMGVGGGAYLEATLATAVVLLALTTLGLLERKTTLGWVRLRVEVTLSDEPGTLERLKNSMGELGLSVKLRDASRDPEASERSFSFMTRVSRKTLPDTLDRLLDHPYVRAVHPQ